MTIEELKIDGQSRWTCISIKALIGGSKVMFGVNPICLQVSQDEIVIVGGEGQSK